MLLLSLSLARALALSCSLSLSFFRSRSLSHFLSNIVSTNIMSLSYPLNIIFKTIMWSCYIKNTIPILMSSRGVEIMGIVSYQICKCRHENNIMTWDVIISNTLMTKIILWHQDIFKDIFQICIYYSEYPQEASERLKIKSQYHIWYSKRL